MEQKYAKAVSVVHEGSNISLSLGSGRSDRQDFAWGWAAMHDRGSSVYRAHEGREAMRLGLRFAKTRVEELDAFIDGVCAGEETMTAALERLAELQALFEAVADLTGRQPQPVSTKREREETLRNVQALSRAAQKEIHTVVVSCRRARGQALAALSALDPDSSPLH